jgi:predicted nucleotidyltransferase
MTNTDQQRLATIKSAALQLIPGCTVYLFGSMARNEQKPGSDYDLLVVAPNHLSIHDKMRLQSRLRKTLAQSKLDADILMESRDELEIKKNLLGHVVRSAVMEGIPL